MLDLQTLKDMRDAAEESRVPIEISPEALSQVITELEAGRAAMAHAGETFGLPPGQTVWE